LNADGKLDLVTANFGASTVSTLLGNGDGTFAPKSDYPVGPEPNCVVIGDLDADDHPDLATANMGAPTVSVLRGKGDGTFGSRLDYGGGFTQFSMGLADLDGDSRPDLVLPSFSFNSILVLPNLSDRPTDALSTLVSSDAQPGRVMLHWSIYSREGGSGASVYRRTGDAGWSRLGVVTLESDGSLSYVDREVESGTKYGYCLGISLSSREVLTGEVWVQVPLSYELTFEGAHPNPAVGRLTVELSLPYVGSGWLDLFDVAGRRVLSRDLAGLGPGRHLLAMDRKARLPAGVYLLRLTYEGKSLMRRVVLIQ